MNTYNLNKEIDSINEEEIAGKVCKSVLHLNKSKYIDPFTGKDKIRNDTHIVKEKIIMKDGKTYNNLKVVENYKRPFYLLKEGYRKYKQKKENEPFEKLDKFMCTESELPATISKNLNLFRKAKSLYELANNPYVFGADIPSIALIKGLYLAKYGEEMQALNDYLALDIEYDVDTKEIECISISNHKESTVFINKRFMETTNVKGMSDNDVKKRLKELWLEHIPEIDLKSKVEFRVEILDDELAAVLKCMERIHFLKPDIVGVWNILTDIPAMVNVIEKNGLKSKDIFSDPSVPEHLRYFKMIIGNTSKVTASGKHSAKNEEEVWHLAECASYFTILDAMLVFKQIRANDKAVPGGYGYDNILKTMTKKYKKPIGKVNFGEVAKGLTGPEYHRFMSKNHFLYYCIYNDFDTLGMVFLDDITTDIVMTLDLFSGPCHYRIFNSVPKRIVIDYFFELLAIGRVLGTKPNKFITESLNRKNWIITLHAHRIQDVGLNMIKEDPSIITNMLLNLMDVDAVSSYPKGILAANVSSETTVREILAINGIPIPLIKLQSVNNIYGPINALNYCNTMFNLPKIDEVDEYIKKERKRIVSHS